MPASTSAALVNVDPKSTQRTGVTAAATRQARARSRSASRSSASSMPTREPDQVVGHLQRATRRPRRGSSGPGARSATPTPPSDSARVKTSVRLQTSSASSSPPATRKRDHAAEPAHLLLRRRRGPGARAGPGRAPGATRGWPTRNSATRSALSQCRSMRTARVFRPRSTSQASNGPGTAPMAFWWKRRRVAPAERRRRVRDDQRAADDVGVAADVLGGRVHDDVGAERERALQVRRREGVVDDEQRAGLVGDLGERRRCRRCPAAGWSGSRPRPPACCPGGSRRGPRRGRPGRHRRVLDAPRAARPGRTAGRCRRRRRRG